jgi:hypothetical protein
MKSFFNIPEAIENLRTIRIAAPAGRPVLRTFPVQEIIYKGKTGRYGKAGREAGKDIIITGDIGVPVRILP